jgi:hypothetical protein
MVVDQSKANVRYLETLVAVMVVAAEVAGTALVVMEVQTAEQVRQQPQTLVLAAAAVAVLRLALLVLVALVALASSSCSTQAAHDELPSRTSRRHTVV